MSVEFFLRLVGMGVLGFGGLQLGLQLATLVGEPASEIWALLTALVGALTGLVLTPYVTTRPVRLVKDYLAELPAQQLVSGVVGLIIGLIVAALVSLPMSLLPTPYNAILPVIAAVVFGYFGTAILSMRRRDVFDMIRSLFPGSDGTLDDGGLTASRQVLLDTSVIIDGRVSDISQTGFIMGPMIVPRFVLNELQHIADSNDMLRRQRGRRGLDILRKLQQDSLVPVRITDMDVEGYHSVDEKLIMLAKRLRCAIVTNDFNLNRIAELQGVLVLNINDLANAVKTVYLPGEEMSVHVIQEGREQGQGVAYLDDGTMVVIEQGRDFIDQDLSVKVTKVLQTAAGRMIFSKPRHIE
ncbi:MAG: TRAM domain-containing protein [Chloroflexi bacterium]|nr:TRAM domain-containing protein [Chloroflexota bacterium]